VKAPSETVYLNTDLNALEPHPSKGTDCVRRGRREDAARLDLLGRTGAQPELPSMLWCRAARE
jgi:hypothetical protein